MSVAEPTRWRVVEDPLSAAAAALAPLRARLGPDLWRRLRVTWVDERRVPADSPDSNRGAAHRAGWLGV